MIASAIIIGGFPISIFRLYNSFSNNINSIDKVKLQQLINFNESLRTIRNTLINEGK